MRYFLAAAIALASCASASAATHHPAAHRAVSPQCGRLNSAIDGAVKELAYINAQDIGDDNVLRATARAARIGAAQSEIQNDIRLMRAGGCRPYQGPLDHNAYLVPAMNCKTARMQDQLSPSPAGSSSGAACDRSSWKPMTVTQ